MIISRRHAFIKWVRLTFCTSVLFALSVHGYAQQPIKIALSTVLTGPVVQYGKMHRDGIHAAANLINAQGGILGRTIELVEYDDTCTPAKTAETATQIASDGIHFVLGPICSGAIPGAAKIYDQHNMIMITATGSSDNLSSQGNSSFFRTIGNDKQQATLAGEYIAGQLKPKALAIIYENQAYGLGLAEQVKTTVEAGGTKPVLYLEFKKGDTDFNGLITQMKQLGIDCVYYGGYHPELIHMLQQAQTQQFNARWIGPGGVASPAVKGTWAEGLLVTLPPDVSKDAANESAVKAIQSREGDPSGSFVMTSYASMQVLAEAIKGANTDNPTQVADYMRKNTFPTVLGNISFNPQGDNINGRFEIFTWHEDATKSPLQ